MASRGMGAINPSKMPKKKEITRTDDPNKVAMYKKGGKVKRYNGEEESAVEEELTKDLTPAQMAARHAASLNRSKQASSSQGDGGLSIKPTHAMLEKAYKRVGANVSKDIPLDDKSRLNFNTDIAAVRAQGQGTKAALDRVGAEYQRKLDKNTTFGASMSKSPSEKRYMLSLDKRFQEGGKVNAAGNYTKPSLRKRIVAQVKAAATQGTGAGQWSARKAQLVAKKYKASGGGYRD